MMKGLVLSVCCGALVAGAAGAAPSQPFRTVRVTGNAVEHSTLSRVKLGDHVRIEDFRVPTGYVNLELDRVEVLAPDAEIWVGTENGLVRGERPDVVILSGSIEGEPGSTAYLAISEFGTNGFIEHHGELLSVSTGLFEHNKNFREALMTAPMGELIDASAAAPQCGYDHGNSTLEPFGPMVEPAEEPQRPAGVESCRIISVAIETDYEYTNRMFGGNTDASAAYAVTLMGAISEIYERDVDTGLSVSFIRTWGTNNDPYSASGDPLQEVRDHWRGTMDSVDRNIVHYLTGKENMDYGGVAYLSTLCSYQWGYGVSGYLNGSFPYPLQDHRSGNWDVTVAAHEMGHNFGTGHTHDSYTPVIDGCGNGDCSDPFGGTIMSYCHTCSGGITNIALSFHPRVQTVIDNYLSGVSCDISGIGVTAEDDSATTFQDASIELDLLANDASASCDTVALSSVPSTTNQGGTLTVLAGAGTLGQDIVEYTPPAGFSGSDSFTYSISGDSGADNADVAIDVAALRSPDTRIDPVAGLRMRYYDLPQLDALPDFDALEPISDEVSTSVEYASTSGEFVNSGLSDDVGAVLDGYVFIPGSGLYTFTTESDDGSALYIGDQLVVDNDGLHGMTKVAGTAALAQGWHKVRIEFFERGGGAGLIATFNGPGLGEGPLSGFFISHDQSAACSPADLNADGVLDFFDLSMFLADQPDWDNSTAFDFFDLSAYLNAFGQGCP